MDIVVGSVTAVRLPDGGTGPGPGSVVEGTVLAVRMPRGSRGGQGEGRAGGEERRRRKAPRKPDPPGSRVLTLLILDPSTLPADLEGAPYRVLLRFVRTS